jgi:hypothetical protein
MKKKILMLAIAVISLSCGDEVPESEQFLTNAPWKVKSIQGRVGTTGQWRDVPITSGGTTLLRHECAFDDTVTFNPDASYTKDEGDLICSFATVTGTWILTSDNKLSITIGGITFIQNVVQLDGETLQVSTYSALFDVLTTYEH